MRQAIVGHVGGLLAPQEEHPNLPRALPCVGQGALEGTAVVPVGGAEAVGVPQKGFRRVLLQKASRRDRDRVVSSTLPGSLYPSFSAPATLLAAFPIDAWLVLRRATPWFACQLFLQSRE